MERISEARTAEGVEAVSDLYSFSSGEAGEESALGPLFLPRGTYIFTVDGLREVTPIYLSDDCGGGLPYSLAHLPAGFVQEIIEIETDCAVRLDVSNAPTDHEWTLRIAAVSDMPVTKMPAGGYFFSSGEAGEEPVLGPLFLPRGVYHYKAVAVDMRVWPICLSGDCGDDLEYLRSWSVMNSTGDYNATRGRSVIEIEADCTVLFDIRNVDGEWALEIVPAEEMPATGMLVGGYSFSGEDGELPVLGPVFLPRGIYMFTADAGTLLVKMTSLSGDCVDDLKAYLKSPLYPDEDGLSREVVAVEADCYVLIDVRAEEAGWTIDIAPAIASEAPATEMPAGGYSFSSDGDGMLPVLGPLFFCRGVYSFSATTVGDMTVKMASLSRNSGDRLSRCVFSISPYEGSDGVERALEVENDCNALLDVFANEAWTLEIKKVS